MARQRSPERELAFQLYKEHEGNISNREIARRLNIPEKTVGGWKCKDKWEEKLNGVLQKDKRSTPKGLRKPGAPKGNKNAAGHGAPKGNKNAERHGFFAKVFPQEVLPLALDIVEKGPLDILWENIIIQYTAIARAQKIMFVKDQNDLTKILKRVKDGDTFSEKEWELQHAWDKHASFLQAQARAMLALEKLMARYEELLQKGLGSEEHRLRLEKLKQDISIEKDKLELAKEKLALEKAKIEKPNDVDVSEYVEALNQAAGEVWENEVEEE
ncbi:Phage terminase small subunit [Moorella glycerini]|uniref:Phage terminase small subunit n=1 Tax=Neomoorella stamsii TaxID=1266720 RepID=A0A9X7J0G5_9FIRM|nr:MULTISPECIES: phage terminase small subunit [Moorella]PRR69608.1 Phage terminase small subunit [Moorella stamsii]CEP67868.1 Phage terminase small subunit [Moorella glycerini]CEP68738.1 Phage terminase small subunit [Moorella glycerini]